VSIEVAGPPTLVELPPVLPFEVTDWGLRLYEALLPLGYDDEANGWALLVFCNAIGLMYERLHELISDEAAGVGWSNLLDVDRCPVEQLPHLAQYVGVRMPTELATEEQRRGLIRDHPNFIRGTKAALIAAVRQTLTGNRQVTVTERYQGNAHQVLVTTVYAETPRPGESLKAAMSVLPVGIKLTFQYGAPP
jgi:Phage tail protein (Tail_P2_I)